MFATGLTGLGVLSLISRDFALNWQPVPDGLPARATLATISGVLLAGGGIAALTPRTARTATLGLTVYVASWLPLLQLPRVVQHPGDAGIWLGFAENTMLAAGGWVAFLSRRKSTAAADTAEPEGRALALGRWIFAAALPVIGWSHFVYADFTAAMVPAWLPWRLGIAYLTGAAHVAAGVGIGLRLWPRLAATLEAGMITAFVALLHLPAVAHEPGSRLQWTMLCVATAYAGAAWAVAGGVKAKSAAVR